jgi:sulfur carrier protein ThiS
VGVIGSIGGLLAAAEQRSVEKRRLVEETITAMRRRGEVITFKTVAEQAGVSRQYPYTHFKDTIEQLRTDGQHQAVEVEGEIVPARSAGRAATIELALRNKIKRLEQELSEVRKEKSALERRFERALGEAEEWRSRHQTALTELLEIRSRLRG